LMSSTAMESSEATDTGVKVENVTLWSCADSWRSCAESLDLLQILLLLLLLLFVYGSVGT
jgi:hypothetical protein